MPKLHSIPIPNLKLNVARKGSTTISYSIPQTHPIRTSNWIRAPTTFLLAILDPHHCLHNTSLSIPNIHNHFPNKASLKHLKLLIARPPKLGRSTNLKPLYQMEIVSQTTPKKLRKVHWSCSIRLATTTGIGNKDRKWVGKLDRVLLIFKVTVPP